MTDTTPTGEDKWAGHNMAFETAYPFADINPTFTEHWCSVCGKASRFPVDQLVQIRHHWRGESQWRSYCPEHANGKEWEKHDPTRTRRNEVMCDVHFILHPVGTGCPSCS
ncbi:hypothetical protein [Microbacterium sp. P5_E9]